MSEINDALEAVRPLIPVFERLGITYRIGGSLASSVHGIGRATMDADLIADLKLEHVPALVQALQGLYYADADLIQDAMRSGQSFNLIHLETFIKVDVFPLSARHYDQFSFSRFLVAKDANFITAEDSVLRKLEWYQLSDGSEKQWNDVIGILRVQAEHLDLEYVHHWAHELGLDALLERALHEANKDQS